MERSFDWSYGDTFAGSETGNVLEFEIRPPGRAAAEPTGRARMPYDPGDEVHCTCPFCAVHNLVPIVSSRAA